MQARIHEKGQEISLTFAITKQSEIFRDIDKLISIFLEKVSSGWPPSLDTFKKVWTGLNFSLIHQASPKNMHPADFVQILFATALTHLLEPTFGELSTIHTVNNVGASRKEVSSTSAAGTALALSAQHTTLETEQSLNVNELDELLEQILGPMSSPGHDDTWHVSECQYQHNPNCVPSLLNVNPATINNNLCNTRFGPQIEERFSSGEPSPSVVLYSPMPNGMSNFQPGFEIDGSNCVSNNHPRRNNENGSKPGIDLPSCVPSSPLDGSSPIMPGQWGADASHQACTHPSPAIDSLCLATLPVAFDPGGMNGSPAKSFHTGLIKRVAALFTVYCLHQTQLQHPNVAVYLPFSFLPKLIHLLDLFATHQLTDAIAVLSRMWHCSAFMVGAVTWIKETTSQSITPGKAGTKSPGLSVVPSLMSLGPARAGLFHVRGGLSGITNFDEMRNECKDYETLRKRLFRRQLSRRGPSTSRDLSRNDTSPRGLFDTQFVDHFESAVKHEANAVLTALTSNSTPAASAAMASKMLRSARSSLANGGRDTGGRGRRQAGLGQQGPDASLASELREAGLLQDVDTSPLPRLGLGGASARALAVADERRERIRAVGEEWLMQHASLLQVEDEALAEPDPAVQGRAARRPPAATRSPASKHNTASVSAAVATRTPPPATAVIEDMPSLAALISQAAEPPDCGCTEELKKAGPLTPLPQRSGSSAVDLTAVVMLPRVSGMADSEPEPISIGELQVPGTELDGNAAVAMPPWTVLPHGSEAVTDTEPERLMSRGLQSQPMVPPTSAVAAKSASLALPQGTDIDSDMLSDGDLDAALDEEFAAQDQEERSKSPTTPPQQPSQAQISKATASRGSRSRSQSAVNPKSTSAQKPGNQMNGGVDTSLGRATGKKAAKAAAQTISQKTKCTATAAVSKKGTKTAVRSPAQKAAPSAKDRGKGKGASSEVEVARKPRENVKRRRELESDADEDLLANLRQLYDGIEGMMPRLGVGVAAGSHPHPSDHNRSVQPGIGLRSVVEGRQSKPRAAKQKKQPGKACIESDRAGPSTSVHANGAKMQAATASPRAKRARPAPKPKAAREAVAESPPSRRRKTAIAAVEEDDDEACALVASVFNQVDDLLKFK